MTKIHKYLDATKLPRRGKYIDWENCVGMELDFIYDNISGKVLIEGYENGVLNISYDNKKSTIRQSKFLLCQFGKLLKKRTNEFKYDIGQRIIDDSRDITITKRENRSDKGSDKKYKKYQYKCNKCGFDCGVHYKAGTKYDEFWTKETAITRGVGCSCCKNEITVNKINDIPTTDLWMVDYFQGGLEEAQRYSANSNKKILPICPYCYQISNRLVKIQDIKKEAGFCSCGDGFPYPEKYVYAFLKALDIDFVYHPNKSHLSWCENFKYDFYIPNLKIIIETHGKQHYEDTSNFNQTFLQQNSIDNNKRELAEINHIEHYIELDCRNSNSDWIRNSILSNKILVNLIGNRNINWNQCAYYAKSSLEKEIIDYINQYEWLMVKDIHEKFGVSKPYVTKVIKNAIDECVIDKIQYEQHKKNMQRKYKSIK